MKKSSCLFLLQYALLCVCLSLATVPTASAALNMEELMSGTLTKPDSETPPEPKAKPDSEKIQINPKPAKGIQIEPKATEVTRTGEIIFALNVDNYVTPVEPGTNFLVGQEVILILSVPTLDVDTKIEITSHPDGERKEIPWPAGTDKRMVVWSWSRPGKYIVVANVQENLRQITPNEITIVAPARSPEKPSLPQTTPTPEAPPKPQVPEKNTKPQEPVFVPQPTSEEEENLKPAPYFDRTGWVYLEDVRAKIWKKGRILSKAGSVENLLITHSQTTYNKGFYVGCWTSDTSKSKKRYVRTYKRSTPGQIRYTIDVTGKYDRFRAIVGPSLWGMAPPNRRDSYGNVTITVNGVEKYKKSFAWNSPDSMIDIDLSQGGIIQIDLQGLAFMIGEPYFRKIPTWQGK